MILLSKKKKGRIYACSKGKITKYQTFKFCIVHITRFPDWCILEKQASVCTPGIQRRSHNKQVNMDLLTEPEEKQGHQVLVSRPKPKGRRELKNLECSINFDARGVCSTRGKGMRVLSKQGVCSSRGKGKRVLLAF
jgi:hypothetical protein